MSVPGPLAGILVVDVTRVLAGPYCTLVLADLGARVIKVEAPARGDDTRQIGPFIGGKSAYFMSLNRGKESIALDLKDAGDRAVFEKLLARADVLAENFRPGVMRRLGYGWDDVHRRFPRLVVASTSGFGQTGPYADRPAYDIVVQAMGGVIEPDRASRRPADAGGNLDRRHHGGALHGHRHPGGAHRTGAQRSGDAGGRRHARFPGGHPRERDRPLRRHGRGAGPRYGLASSLDRTLRGARDARRPRRGRRRQRQALFAALCETVGRPELAADPRFASNELRCRNLDALGETLEGALSAHTSEHWIAALQRAACPAGP